MPASPRILILEDNPDDADLMVRALEKYGIRAVFRRTQDRAGFAAALEDFHPDLILSDYRLPDIDGMAALGLARNILPDAPVIIVSGAMGEEEAVACMKAGAEDYILKDRIARLGQAVNHALDSRTLRQDKVRAAETLRISEKENRAIVEAVPDLLFRLDPDGLILSFHSERESDLYAPADSFLNKRIQEVLPPHVTIPAMEAVVRTLADHTPSEFEYHLDIGDSRMYFECRMVSLAPNQVLAFIRDITERKCAEAALDREQNRFRILSEHSPFGLVLIGKNGRWNYINPRFTEMLGVGPGELSSGKDWFRLAFPDPDHRREAIRVWRRDAQSLKTGSSAARNFTVRCKNGASKILSIMTNRLDSGDYLLSFQDISERMGAEDALRRSEERYRTLFEGAAIGIYRADSAGRLIVANPALVRMLGYTSSEEFRNATLEESGFHPVFKTALRREELQQKGQVIGLEGAWRRRDGAPLHIRQSVVVHRDPDGRPRSYEGTIEDITQLKHMEEQFLQAQKMEAMGRLAGGVAHDFNNVLMVLMSYSDLMLRALTPDDPLALFAREIRAAAGQAAALTGKLLAFSRRQVVRLVPVDLNTVIRESLGMLKPLLMEDVEISSRLQPDLPPVLADPSQLIQVLVNLAVNARDAMPHGGVLSLRTRTVAIRPDGDPDFPGQPPGDWVELSVGDTGGGMADEVKRRAFEPFFTTKGPGKGTGLGLSTCFGIIQQFGGSILLDSRPGEGTCVRILLSPHAGIEAKGEEQTPAPSALSTRPATILLVEDEQAVRVVMAEVLGMYGYTVISAMNAEEALREAEHAPVLDCVITDVVMPLMSGPELVARLTEQRPDLKVILMSGHAGKDLPDRYSEQGYKFLQKPFSMDALIRLVQEILSK